MFKSYMKFLEKYGAFVIAFGCLIYLLTSWGNDWIFTWILLAGLIICPLIGISDMKENKSQKH